MSDDFESCFERTGSVVEPPGPWQRLWEAHLHARPVRARVLGPALEGWHVEVETLPGVLHREGAPSAWGEGPPAEVEAWVLSLDRDRAELRLLAWSPKAGPGPASLPTPADE